MHCALALDDVACEVVEGIATTLVILAVGLVYVYYFAGGEADVDLGFKHFFGGGDAEVVAVAVGLWFFGFVVDAP